MNAPEQAPKSESYQEQVDELYKLKEEVLQAYRKVGKNTKLTLEAMQFGKQLIAKYGDREARQYAAFHILVGSSGPSVHNAKFFDFAGDDSVMNFFTRKMSELSLEKKEVK